MEITWFNECNNNVSENLGQFLQAKDSLIASQLICEDFQKQLIFPTWLSAMGLLISLVILLLGWVKYGEFTRRKKTPMILLSLTSVVISVISAVSLGTQTAWLTFALSALLGLTIFILVLLSPQNHQNNTPIDS